MHTMREPSPVCSVDSQQSGVLIYDGYCRLCVAVTAGLDRAGAGAPGAGVRMIPYESAEAAAVLGERYQPGPPAMAYHISPTGAVSQGLEAFLPVIPCLPGGARIQRILRWSCARALAERAYGWIAKHRYRLFGAVHTPIQ